MPQPYTRPVHGDAFSDSSATDATVVVDALADGLEALETPTLNTQTGDYTLVLGDFGKTVEIDSALGRNLTVPAYAQATFPVGTQVGLRQYGVGQVTVVGAGGVTVRSRGGALKLAGQYAEAVLTKRATDEWVLTGDVTT